MSRSLLVLYTLDRDALRAFSTELQDALRKNDGEALANTLELAGSMKEEVVAHPELIDVFLRAETHPSLKTLLASARRVAKKRALGVAFESEALSLEGRLRELEVLRENKQVAKALDRLLNTRRLPWFLRREGCTGGWIDSAMREQLDKSLRSMRSSLTPEVADFAQGLMGVPGGDVLMHDAL